MEYCHSWKCSCNNVITHSVDDLPVCSAVPTTIVGMPPTAGKVASKVGGKTRERVQTLSPNKESRRARENSEPALEWPSRYSTESVTNRIVRGVRSHPFQIFFGGASCD
jgi:hypothetical protein